MIQAAIPEFEKERLANLYSYQILDTLPEEDFNHLVELASLICRCDMSVINFIDADRQWGKAEKGLGDTEAPRQISMCAHTILSNEVMLIEDTLLDTRFFDNPFVTEGGVRFYAGAPICSEKGFNLGTLCVCDIKPRILEQQQVDALKKLARQAAVLLEIRKKNVELQNIARREQELKEQAQAAQKAQEQFLSTMSHEIRTPLNGIIGMVELMEDENLQEDQKENLRTLKFSSDNLLCIVNDILDYNKISAGKITLEEIDFNIYQLISDIKKAHLVKTQEKGIELFISIDSKIPENIKGDPTRLTQILHNLVGNAVKFTKKGSVSIVLKWGGEDEGTVVTLFEIKDTGIGIEQNMQGAIFDQFSQANDGITRQFGGTGLGLAITKKLVELMGSEIKISSQINEGSCFYFELRCKKSGQSASKTNKEEALIKDDLSRLKVLIAEDNAVNIMVLKKVLLKWGINPDESYNGQEAIDKITEKQYDLVLMDMQMPVMDGLTAIKKFRRENIYDGPVLLITADAFINVNNQVVSWGFDDFILKPFKADDLYTKIKRVTSKASA